MWIRGYKEQYTYKTEQDMYKTEQERFWAGNFGNDYTKRNEKDLSITNNIALFATILSRTNHISSLIEFGAGTGLNLRAIKQLLPAIELSAVEINPTAVAGLKNWGGVLYMNSRF